MADADTATTIDEGPNGPGSLGRLIPWPDDETYPNIGAEEALDLFLGWVEGRGIELWPHQEEALLSLAAGDHLILGTPTGSGKSMVALGMCFMSVCTDRRAYYTAPIKALVSEKFFDLVDLFGRENVGMITGDASINAEAPIICCTAEILANQALREGEKCDVGCVAMDEFHFYADPDRGWAWQVPLLTLPHAQFLLMSATLGDTTAIANLLEVRYASNSEEARDGGATFTFLGGDYSRTGFSVSDRIRFGNERRVHNLIIGWQHKTVEGIWYEQTAYYDPEKNNQLAFKIQTSGLKNRETASTLQGEYRFDLLREGTPSFSLDAGARLEQSETIHYEGDGNSRKYTRVTGGVTASKFFFFGRNQLTAALGVAGGSALNASQTVQERLREVYTDPQFEYMTGTWMGGNVEIRYRRLFGNLWGGLFARAALKYYLGANTFTDRYDATDRRCFTFGAEILF